MAFQTGQGRARFDATPRLESLTDNTDPGIKYFSGTTTYQINFSAPTTGSDSAAGSCSIWGKCTTSSK